MKKVFHVIHGLTTGGAETLVKDYALKIDKEQFDIHIICLNKMNTIYEEILEKAGVDIVYLSNMPNSSFFSKLFCLIKKYHRLRKIVHNEKPDILHTHLPINNLIKYSKPYRNTTIIHTVHNEPKILWNKKIRRKIDFLAAKYLVKKYNMRFIVLHEEMRKEINEMFNVNNSIVLNNGIDFDRFDKNKIRDRDNFRNDLLIPKDAFVVGHIGRFNEQKNHRFLADIFYQIVKQKNNSYLLLIGDGEEKENIIHRLDDLGLKNKYLILSNRKDIPDLLNVMDAFVFPSIFEGLGIVLIEAQKMNVSCFVSEQVPSAATISNLVTKISLLKSAKEWANIIVKYKKPKKIEICGDEWDMNEVIKKLEKIYKDEI